MKKILILIILVVCSLNMYAQQRCKAITLTGKQCSRIAVIDGYCKQHYYNAINKVKIPNKPKIDLPEEWQAISINNKNQDNMTAWRDTTTNIIHFSFNH